MSYNISDELISSFNLIDGIKAEIDARRFIKEHPYYFYPCGCVIFCGAQGQGKTLSSVRYIRHLMLEYSKCICITNTFLQFDGVDNSRFVNYEGIEQIYKYDNGYEGIILFIDEIQTEFNSLESKNIDPSIFQIISQQRKRRLHVVGTTQLRSRLAKPWREQLMCSVNCRNYFKRLQINCIESWDGVSEDEDGTISPRKRSFYFFFHHPRDYSSYNTFEKVRKVESHTSFNFRRKLC